jgi:ATP-binding cassette subfamily B protein
LVRRKAQLISTGNESAYFELLREKSLLSWLLEPDELSSLLRNYPPISVAAGAVVFSEGEVASDLIIVLSGKVDLQSKSHRGDAIEMGSLTGGRSANLHALVRSLPYEYSGIAAEDSELVRVPWRTFENAVKRSPAIEPYLLAITEDPVIRSIAKEVGDVGCSQKFRVELLGSLKDLSLKSQSWVLQQGQMPEFAFMLVSGSLQSYSKPQNGKVATLCPVPARTWIAWSECEGATPVTQSYRSTGTSRIIALPVKVLADLRVRFPKDFHAYGEWVRKAVQGSHVDYDGPREEVEVDKLFPEAPVRKRLLRWSYPWVPQENQMDCGPACLAMISKFYDHEVPIQHWRNEVFTNKEGTSLFDLAKGAERAGFSTHGLYVEDLSELEASSLPAIAIRRYHFVVIYKITAKEVVIGDPGAGVIRMPLREFHAGFENAVLLLRPTDAFFGVPQPSVGNGHYLQLFQGYGRELSLVLACSVLWVVFSLFPPLLMQIIMDEVLAKKDLAMLAYALGLVAVVTVLQAGMGWLRSYYVAYMTSKFDFRATSAFLRKMFSLPYSFFANRHVGDFTRRLSEMERLREFLTNEALSTFLSLLTLGVYGVVLVSYSPLIALVTFAVAPILVLISMLFTQRLRQTYFEAFASRAEEESLLNDLIRGVPTIKALAAEVPARWRMEERNVKTLRSQYRFALSAAALGAISEAYGKLARLGLMGGAAYLAVRGEMTPGQIVSLSVLVNHVIDPFQNLATTWSKVQELRSAMTRLNDIFLAPSEASEKKNALTKQRMRGEIEFQDVWFRYGGDSSDWVLKGVSFKIEPGRKVAVVGPSGSGKSTIANLLLRLFEPTRGQIFIDGRDYREYDLEWLRGQVGLILQESHLFNGTVAENIAFGDPQPDERRVRESAALANAHDFIMKKPKGYEYIVTHGGFGLSGGEKQRVSCARAFYSNPPILILDEATSALDGVAEKDLLKGLLGASKERTVLSIAHRFTTARYFGEVLVMNGGKVVAFGSHEHLEQNSELYRALFGLGSENAA